MNKLRNRVTIITNGYFPVPATMGGAVEALDENLIRQNEQSKEMDLTIFSCYEKEAEKIAKTYTNTNIQFVRIPALIRGIDMLIYHLAKDILKKENCLSYRCIFQRLYYIFVVARKLKKEDYGRIVLENHPVLFMILKLFGNYKKYGGRYYFHLHNAVTKEHGCHTIMANCRKVLGVSSYINGTFQEFLGSNDNNEYVILKNKIDRKKFAVPLSAERKNELKQQYSIADNDIVLLFTGRFSPEKGVRELLEAFGNVKNPQVKLLVVGGYFFGSGIMNPFEQEMKKLAESMKDRVRFTGFVDYDKIPEFYALADMVVIPSVWDDPAPLTVIESLTCGKALITTYSGGIPEYADPESSIILKRDKDLIMNLTSAIEELARSPEQRKRMEQAVTRKTAEWTLERFYHDFCELVGD